MAEPGDPACPVSSRPATIGSSCLRRRAKAVMVNLLVATSPDDAESEPRLELLHFPGRQECSVGLASGGLSVTRISSTGVLWNFADEVTKGEPKACRSADCPELKPQGMDPNDNPLRVLQLETGSGSLDKMSQCFGYIDYI